MTPIQIQELESGVTSKEDGRKISEEFDRENEWQEFLNRINGLLRNAIAEDGANDPEAPARYDGMVHPLEGRRESFTLWACCVPAIPGYKSAGSRHWLTIVVQLLILAVIICVALHALKIL